VLVAALVQMRMRMGMGMRMRMRMVTQECVVVKELKEEME